jgi:hypothetical protein
LFARLTGFYQYPTKHVLHTGWKECTWVETARKATRLSRSQSERLVAELREKQPGPEYRIERDEDGEENLPPYGLDDFVVRKIPVTGNSTA